MNPFSTDTPEETEARIEARLIEDLENMVTEVPDYHSGPEYYVEGPKHNAWLLSHDPKQREEGLRCIQETIAKEELEEADPKFALYKTWVNSDGQRHPMEGELAVGGHCGLMKCDDQRLTEILSPSR